VAGEPTEPGAAPVRHLRFSLCCPEFHAATDNLSPFGVWFNAMPEASNRVSLLASGIALNQTKNGRQKLACGIALNQTPLH
jgi:hypothetical protein